MEHFLGLAVDAGFEVRRLQEEVPSEYRVPDVRVVLLRIKEGSSEVL